MVGCVSALILWSKVFAVATRHGRSRRGGLASSMFHVFKNPLLAFSKLQMPNSVSSEMNEDWPASFGVLGPSSCCCKAAAVASDTWKNAEAQDNGNATFIGI